MFFYLFLCSLIFTFDFVEGYSRSKEKIKNVFLFVSLLTYFYL